MPSSSQPPPCKREVAGAVPAALGCSWGLLRSMLLCESAKDTENSSELLQVCRAAHSAAVKLRAPSSSLEAKLKKQNSNNYLMIITCQHTGFYTCLK